MRILLFKMMYRHKMDGLSSDTKALLCYSDVYKAFINRSDVRNNMKVIVSHERWYNRAIALCGLGVCAVGMMVGVKIALIFAGIGGVTAILCNRVVRNMKVGLSAKVFLDEAAWSDRYVCNLAISRFVENMRRNNHLHFDHLSKQPAMQHIPLPNIYNLESVSMATKPICCECVSIASGTSINIDSACSIGIELMHFYLHVCEQAK